MRDCNAVRAADADVKDSPELLLKKARIGLEAEPPYNPSYHHMYADPYLWLDSWARVSSAFRPWPAAVAKDGKSQPPILRDSAPTTVPAFLSHSPPVLLHPERVVPMSESERFERSFQPNVALAPIPRQRLDTVSAKNEVFCVQVKTEVVRTNCGAKSPCLSISEKLSIPPPPSPDSIPNPDPRITTPHYNPEIELSTDTDDSSSDVAGDAAPDSDIAAVLEALGETSEGTRVRVVRLVQQLVAKYQRLQEHNSELERLNQEQERRIVQLEQRLQEQDSPIKQDPDAFQDKIAAMEKEMRTLRSEMVNHRMRESSRSSGGSPVSVITSPPPIVIKSEPVGSE